jgi:hypothetical protein
LLHVPADLSSGKKPPVLIEQEAGWVEEPVWTVWITEKSLFLPGIELQLLFVWAEVSSLYS